MPYSRIGNLPCKQTEYILLLFSSWGKSKNKEQSTKLLINRHKTIIQSQGALALTSS
jgi:hypothetical protein